MQSNRRNIALNQKFFEGDEDSDTLVSASSVSPEAQPKTARPVLGVPKLAPRAKGRDHHWKRRRVCAVLTDGAFTLALTTFNGESSVFPHTRKLYKREVLRDAALRALAEGLHLESTALSPDVRVALGLPVVVRASNTVYSVFCCSAQALQPLLNSCQPASPLLVQWLPCGPAATSLAFQEDAHMFQQLAAALEERLLPQPQHSHVDVTHNHTPIHMHINTLTTGPDATHAICQLTRSLLFTRWAHGRRPITPPPTTTVTAPVATAPHSATVATAAPAAFAATVP